MATRSTISILEKNGTVKTIYCNWDGYLSHNGEFLKQYYNTADKVNELISNGSMSSLRENIEKSVFYHRDRNEDLVINEFDSLETYHKYLEKNTEKFNYLFVYPLNKWFCSTHEMPSVFNTYN